MLLGLALLATQVGELPAPTGVHPVGTRLLALVDQTRPGPDGSPGRPLTVQLWYPAAPEGGEPAPYATDDDLLAWLVDLEYYGQSAATLEGWASLTTHARRDAPFAAPEAGGPFPVLLFSHGLGVARMNYTALAAELAGQGFAVAVVDHPAGGVTITTDGQMLSTEDDPEIEPHWMERCEDWAADHRLVLTALAERFPVGLATDRAGVLGHSMGGAAALLAGGGDPRLVACADLDGAPTAVIEQQGLRRPSLFVKAVAVYPGPGQPDDLAALWSELAARGPAPGLSPRSGAPGTCPSATRPS
jgi:pimeloyl-ACP methyl ester carboxylesterase